jgi:predicted kinase
MKELVLVRGIPGSGKSTLSKLIASSILDIQIEADMFFLNENNEYHFDASKLKDAHNWCRENVENYMSKAYGKIVVSNTFTQEWEMEPYFELAKKYGYRVHSIIVENRHGGENQHEVPEDKLTQMVNRFNIKLN